MKKILILAASVLLITLFAFSGTRVFADTSEIMLYSGGDNEETAAYDPKEHDMLAPDCPFSKPLHQFVFWNTQSDGSGEMVMAGEVLPDDFQHDLYAVWQPLSIHADGVVLQKMIEGSPSESETFRFVIEPVEDGADQSVQYVEITGQNEMDTLGWDYQKEGKYIYLVHEEKGERPGWSYSEAKYYVINEVVYDGKTNQLHVEQTILNEQDQEVSILKFVNVYRGCDEVTTGISFEKKAEGKEPEGMQYDFRLQGSNAWQPMPEGTENGTLMIRMQKGTYTSGQWTYRGEGTWHFTLCEMPSDNENCQYDDSVFTITDTTVHDESGVLTLLRTITKEDGTTVDSICFTNVWKEKDTPARSDVVITAARQEKIVPNTAETK